MMNIEVKARLRDRAAVEDRLAGLEARRMWTLRQDDTFFAVPRGWLKLREVPGRRPELISYVRPTDHSGPRASDYDVMVLEEAASWKRLLGRVLPVDGIVAKERTLWLCGRTRIHLDRVDGLGEFIELETVVDGITSGEGREEAARIAAALGIEDGDRVAVPYRELLR